MSPSDPLLEALLRVERAQEGRERSLKMEEALLSTISTVAEVLAGQKTDCEHVGVFVHSCGPCVRREVLMIIKQGVDRALE